MLHFSSVSTCQPTKTLAQDASISKALRRCLVWDDQLKIKGDANGDDEIIVFGCTVAILHGNDPKSPLFLKSSPNPVIRYLSLRSGIQDHPWAVILD